MGCMRNFFAMIGCAIFVAALVIGVWVFRDDLKAVYERVRARQSVVVVTPQGDTVSIGVPSPGALARAEAKEAALMAPRGPAFIELSADEAAALIVSRLEPAARAAVESLTVSLARDRVTLSGQIRLDLLGRDLLGPLADVLGGRQPLRVAGPLAVPAPGHLAWAVDEFVVREFAFPNAAIPTLVNRLAGDTTGTFEIPVPETVDDVRVRADGIVFYRRVP